MVRIRRQLTKHTHDYIEIDENLIRSSKENTCIYLGGYTNNTIQCKSCRGHVETKVYNCSIHGKCTLGKNGEINGCLDCKNKLIIPTNQKLIYDLVDKINLPQTDILPKGWSTWETTIKAHQLASDIFLTSLQNYPENKYSGKGIVIVGGGKYWPSIYITIKMIRYLGCILPIEVWYSGQEEKDERYESLLALGNVIFINAIEHPEAKNVRCLTGHQDPERGGSHPSFELKSFAVLHSPFEEVLFLDADNYPCVDPTILFEECGYKETGGVFWPDLPHTNEWTKWDFWGVKKFGYNCGLEVGQYLINKKVAWKQLNLARWYDDHGDWCYGWGHYGDHGDKGSHRVAWAKLGKNYTMYSTEAKWAVIAFLQVGPDGKTPMFVHRCKSKFVLDTTPFSSTPQENTINIRAKLPLEDIAFSFLEELKSKL